MQSILNGPGRQAVSRPPKPDEKPVGITGLREHVYSTLLQASRQHKVVVRFNPLTLQDEFGVDLAQIRPELDHAQKAMESCHKLGLSSPFIAVGQAKNLTRSQLKSYFSEELFGPVVANANRARFVRGHVSNLDQINYKILDTAVPWALGLDVRAALSTIAKAAVDQEILPALMPPKHRPRKNALSPYFDQNVVGDLWLANLRQHLKDRFKTIDHIKPDKLLASALGVNPTVEDMARRIIELDLMEPEIPYGHPFARSAGGVSFFLRPEIVGAVRALANFAGYIKYTFSSLDQIAATNPGALFVMSDYLKLPRNGISIARYLVAQDILLAIRPPGSPFGIGNRLSFYLESSVVGQVLARKNLEDAVHEHFTTLDDLDREPSRHLMAALGLGKVSRASLAAKLIGQRMLSGLIPESHLPNCNAKSLYFNPEAVGPALAAENLRRWLELKKGQAEAPDSSSIGLGN